MESHSKAINITGSYSLHYSAVRRSLGIIYSCYYGNCDFTDWTKFPTQSTPVYTESVQLTMDSFGYVLFCALMEKPYLATTDLPFSHSTTTLY